MRAGESGQPRLPITCQNLLLDRKYIRKQHNKKQRGGEIPQNQQIKQSLPKPHPHSLRRLVNPHGHRLPIRRKRTHYAQIRPEGTGRNNQNIAEISVVLRMIVENWINHNFIDFAYFRISYQSYSCFFSFVAENISRIYEASQDCSIASLWYIIIARLAL